MIIILTVTANIKMINAQPNNGDFKFWDWRVGVSLSESRNIPLNYWELKSYPTIISLSGSNSLCSWSFDNVNISIVNVSVLFGYNLAKEIALVDEYFFGTLSLSPVKLDLYKTNDRYLFSVELFWAWNVVNFNKNPNISKSFGISVSYSIISKKYN